VADAWQRHGLALSMMRRLIDAARAAGLRLMVGHVLAANTGMLRFCERLGFTIEHVPGDAGMRRVSLGL
jgi:acetyltransferase